MTDAIDREQHGVGAADQTLEQPATFLDAAVVMQEDRAGALRDGAQMPDLGLPPANLEKSEVR